MTDIDHQLTAEDVARINAIRAHHAAARELARSIEGPGKPYIDQALENFEAGFGYLKLAVTILRD